MDGAMAIFGICPMIPIDAQGEFGISDCGRSFVSDCSTRVTLDVAIPVGCRDVPYIAQDSCDGRYYHMAS